MPIFLTEYNQGPDRYAGPEIEADNATHANQVAARVAALERSCGGAFTALRVIGEKVDEIPMDAEWLTTTVTCDKCTHRWVAVFPLCASHLECPNCQKLVKVTNLLI